MTRIVEPVYRKIGKRMTYKRPVVEKIYKRIGARVRAERKAQGITQEALAKKAKTSRPHLTRIENGTQRIWPHTLQDIARVLKIDPLDIMWSVWK